MARYGQEGSKEAIRAAKHVVRKLSEKRKSLKKTAQGAARDLEKMGKEIKSKAKGSLAYRASTAVGSAVIGSKEGRAIKGTLKKLATTGSYPLTPRKPKKATTVIAKQELLVPMQTFRERYRKTQQDRKRSRRTGAR